MLWYTFYIYVCNINCCFTLKKHPRKSLLDIPQAASCAIALAGNNIMRKRDFRVQKASRRICFNRNNSSWGGQWYIDTHAYLVPHSSEKRGLRSMKCSSETLQNLLYFMYKKTRVVFFAFHSVQLYIFTSCRHRPGHSQGKNIKLHEMKNEKNYMGFLIHKI